MKRRFFPWLLVLLPSMVVRAQTVTFVVGSAADWPAGTNAFIVTLSDPQQVSYARVLAATGGLMKDFDTPVDPFPVFTVEVGADGTNRNVALPGQPAWSWHVTGIAYWTSGWSIPEYPYQHPWQLEQAIREGAITGQITIRFTDSYTFMAEVDPEFRLYEHLGVRDGFYYLYLYWTHQSPGMGYDIDYTPSLAQPNWQPFGLETLNENQMPDVGPWDVYWCRPGAVSVFPVSSGLAYFRLRAQP